MGVLGEMFPGRKIADEAGEDGDAQPFRLGPIDLERGVVQIRARRQPQPQPEGRTPEAETPEAETPES